MSTASMNAATAPVKEIPRGALQLRVGAGAATVRFSAAGNANELEITMFARSPEAIEHWYWNRIVHDMKGMKLRKDRIPLDWMHEYEINVGWADKFDASESKGLHVRGRLVSVGSDKAAEVIARLKAGVPYESSIDFAGPMRIETLDKGMSAKCNGRTIEGPASIIREWTLNAVAVCPFGADPNTRTQFSASRPGGMVAVAVESIDPRIEELWMKGYSRDMAKCILAIGDRMTPQVKRALGRK